MVSHNDLHYRETGKEPYGNKLAFQNDKDVYHDFISRQEQLKNKFAGAASNNNIAADYYNSIQHQGFKKFKEANHDPTHNRFNIFERSTKYEVPKTRDRFIHNPLANLIAPTISKKETTKEGYKHDKLDVKDIDGAKPDIHGMKKLIEGRDIMDTTDIEKTKPKQLKQNRISNIPDYNIDPSDINKKEIQKGKFVTNRVTDPLNPQYRLETVSRRHIIDYGVIEGSAPKLSISPTTKRLINRTNDIQGSTSKNMGTVPGYRGNVHNSYSSMLPTIPEDGPGMIEDHHQYKQPIQVFHGDQIRSKRQSLPDSMRFASGGQHIMDDQSRHIMEIKTGHRQMPNTSQLREMTESRRAALLAEMPESKRMALE